MIIESSKLKTIYLQPAFLICAALLAMAGGGMSIAIKSFGVYLKKEPLPLKKSLDLLDENGLAPYRVVSKSEIKSADVVESLGTKDYIQWQLEDIDVAAGSPVRHCSLFITYYEIPDIVVHVPEECYTGGGQQRLASDSITFHVDKGSGVSEEIPGKYLVFSSVDSKSWRKNAKFPVMYTFNVNGVYKGSREGTRLALNKNLRSKYSYFSKVELKFFNTVLGSPVYPGKKDALEASQKLLGVILPILERKHWPGDPKRYEKMLLKKSDRQEL